MSHHTTISIQSSDILPSLDEVLAPARQWLEAQGYAVDDVLDDIRAAIEDGSSLVNDLVSSDFDALMVEVSNGTPNITFYVRGMGEEYPDVWLRQFRGGQIVSRVGPFDELAADD